MDPRKRWITVAHRTAGGWRISAPRPVGPVGALLPALLAESGGAAVALGLDLPLGLPGEYVERHVAEPDFPAFLRALADRPAFFEVCATLADVSAARPFYPLRNGPGMTRAAHAAALGLSGPAAFARRCDRVAGGAPLFWTLGAQQVGKAALAAWRDLLLPAADLRLWPFDGELLALLAPGRIVVAETYPGEALRHLPTHFRGSKRRQADRAVLAPTLREAMEELGAEADAGLIAEIESGFGADAAGEDRFDTVVGLLCLLNVLAERRAEGVPDDPWVRRWEGWVLGRAG